MDARKVAMITGASSGIGRAILHAVRQPEHITVTEITVRPTGQEL